MSHWKMPIDEKRRDLRDAWRMFERQTPAELTATRNQAQLHYTGSPNARNRYRAQLVLALLSAYRTGGSSCDEAIDAVIGATP